MRPPFGDSPEFVRLLDAARAPADPPIDLALVALEIASDAYPGLDHAGYLARLSRLADRVRDRCTALDRARQVLGQINWVLYVEEGFRGNTDDYHDPRNSYLNEVIDRKLGIPISLAVVYGRIAQRLGVVLDGVSTPGHFLLRLRATGGGMEAPLFVDPFHQGALLDRRGVAQRLATLLGADFELRDEVLAPCTSEVFVARMLRNLQRIYLQTHDLPAALPILRRLAALRADDAGTQRDLAMVCLKLDRPAEAIPPLERLATLPSRTDDDRRLLQAARRDAARRN